MTAERWARVAAVFEAVIDLSPADREARLDGLCGDDTELHAEVVRLLDADGKAGDLRRVTRLPFRAAP